MEAVLPSCLLLPCIENFLGSHSQVWSITLVPSSRHSLVSRCLTSAERILSAPFAKVRIISETNKLFEDLFLFIQASGSVFVRTSGTHGFNKVDLSIPIGLSYEISDFVIDARYNFGLTHIYKDDPGSSKNGVIMLTVGYKIPLQTANPFNMTATSPADVFLCASTYNLQLTTYNLQTYNLHLTFTHI